MALVKFGDKIGNGEWDEWGYPNCCFLCGNKFEYMEEVILWSGVIEATKITLPPNLPSPQAVLLWDDIGKKLGGFQEALAICWHIDCVPSFCRRILQDWEKEQEEP